MQNACYRPIQRLETKARGSGGEFGVLCHAVQHQGGYFVVHLRPGLCQCRGKTTAETPCQYLGQRLFEQRIER